MQTATLVNLTTKELAQRLHIGRTKAYELVASGKLAHMRIGTKILVPVAAVEAFERRSLREAR